MGVSASKLQVGKDNQMNAGLLFFFKLYYKLSCNLSCLISTFSVFVFTFCRLH